MLTHEQIMTIDTIVLENPEKTMLGVHAFVGTKQEPEHLGVMHVAEKDEAEFVYLIAAAPLMYTTLQDSCQKLQQLIDDCEKAGQAAFLIPFFTSWMNEIMLVQRVAQVGSSQTVNEAIAEQKSLTASQALRKL